MEPRLRKEIEMTLAAAKEMRPCHSKLDNVIARLEKILAEDK